jgi:hypothetical protein
VLSFNWHSPLDLIDDVRTGNDLVQIFVRTQFIGLVYIPCYYPEMSGDKE